MKGGTQLPDVVNFCLAIKPVKRVIRVHERLIMKPNELVKTSMVNLNMSEYILYILNIMYIQFKAPAGSKGSFSIGGLPK